MRHQMAAFALFFAAVSPCAASEEIPDQYPQSVLYSKPVEIIPYVWSAIGATAPPSSTAPGIFSAISTCPRAGMARRPRPAGLRRCCSPGDRAPIPTGHR